MTDIRFPVIEGKGCFWPDQAICPICGEKRVFEPHSMAIVTAGALLIDPEGESGSMSNDLAGFLSLTWHGAHYTDNGSGQDVWCTVDVIRDARGGQGELYFCSTECLRKFFNQCVDELERKIRGKGSSQFHV